MKFNLNDLNPGVFFQFDENDKEEGGVTVRLATSDKVEEMDNA